MISKEHERLRRDLCFRLSKAKDPIQLQKIFCNWINKQLGPVNILIYRYMANDKPTVDGRIETTITISADLVASLRKEAILMDLNNRSLQIRKLYCEDKKYVFLAVRAKYNGRIVATYFIVVPYIPHVCNFSARTISLLDNAEIPFAEHLARFPKPASPKKKADKSDWWKNGSPPPY